MLLLEVDRLLCGGVLFVWAPTIGGSTWVMFSLREEQTTVQQKCAHLYPRRPVLRVAGVSPLIGGASRAFRSSHDV